MNIATRLYALRIDHGYSQDELAQIIGISRQAVSKWERAESVPDTDNLLALSQLYDVTIDELVKGPSVSGTGAAEVASGGNAAEGTASEAVAEGEAGEDAAEGVPASEGAEGRAADEGPAEGGPVAWGAEGDSGRPGADGEDTAPVGEKSDAGEDPRCGSLPECPDGRKGSASKWRIAVIAAVSVLLLAVFVLGFYLLLASDYAFDGAPDGAADDAAGRVVGRAADGEVDGAVGDGADDGAGRQALSPSVPVASSYGSAWQLGGDAFFSAQNVVVEQDVASNFTATFGCLPTR